MGELALFLDALRSVLYSSGSGAGNGDAGSPVFWPNSGFVNPF